VSGRIVCVGTPIGNLGDLSSRAIETLAAADVVACEDTRRTGRLLRHAGVRAPRLVRMDEHTERSAAAGLVALAAAGATVAVVSDAGLPALSDPGAVIVARAVVDGVPVEVVPGPFAGAVAFVGSGLAADGDGRFCFEGFLPRKGASRQRRLVELRGEQRTVVLYEAPHRLARTLADLAEVLGGDRRVALCRELTKLHEETWRGTLDDAVAHTTQREPRGEYVVVIEGAPAPGEPDDEELRAALARRIAAGASRRDAAAEVASELGVAPNRVKRLAQGADPDA
jgi:16S rRNA (cytidine1402-2'-O)-methyltransferase